MIPAVTVGMVTVVVGFASSAVLVIQAASVAGATSNLVASWMLATCTALGATSVGLSRWFRTPIVAGWSTPGARRGERVTG